MLGKMINTIAKASGILFVQEHSRIFRIGKTTCNWWQHYDFLNRPAIDDGLMVSVGYEVILLRYHDLPKPEDLLGIKGGWLTGEIYACEIRLLIHKLRAAGLGQDLCCQSDVLDILSGEKTSCEKHCSRKIAVAVLKPNLVWTGFGPCAVVSGSVSSELRAPVTRIGPVSFYRADQIPLVPSWSLWIDANFYGVYRQGSLVGYKILPVIVEGPDRERLLSVRLSLKGPARFYHRRRRLTAELEAGEYVAIARLRG